jgi:O-acetyl-ADP-ribose deacetylase (regulator of RNase III)
MPRIVKVFISYRNVDFSKNAAQKLATRLRNDSYEVFWDVTGIGGGDKWAQTIYDNIYTSDVLLVLLQEETADSDWVQREVDVARGLHIEILPVSLVPGIDQSKTIQRLALRDVQFRTLFSLGEDDEEYQTLVKDIEKLAKRTYDAQTTLMDLLRRKRRGKRADNVQRCATFRLPGSTDTDPRIIYLATGDLAALRDIDVLVNTENDFMQMARVHENNTVSSCLRWAGAHLLGASQLVEDVVQDELNALLQAKFHHRPIGISNVIITSAGHAQGRLRKRNKVRYIAHTSTVEVRHGNRKVTMQPVDTDEGVEDCVRNTLEALAEVDSAAGVISPEGERRREQERIAGDYQSLTSIAFPLFGAGAGGRSASEIVPAMIAGFKQFWADNPDSPLREITLCVYLERDVQVVFNRMRESLVHVSGGPAD